MKKHIKSFTKLLSLALVLIFTNCQKEEKNIDIETSAKSRYKINLVSKAEYNHVAQITESLEKVNEELNNTHTRTEDEDNYNFTILTDYSKYVESPDGSLHSYTFKIERDEPSELLENIVFTSNNDGDYLTTLVTYYFPDFDTIGLKHEEIDFDSSLILNNVEQRTCISWLVCAEWGYQCYNCDDPDPQLVPYCVTYEPFDPNNTVCEQVETIDAGDGPGSGNPSTNSGPQVNNGSQWGDTVWTGSGIPGEDGFPVSSPTTTCDAVGQNVGLQGSSDCSYEPSEIPSILINEFGFVSPNDNNLIDWLNNPLNIDVVNELNLFLTENNNSFFSIEEAKIRLYKEYADDTNGWEAISGTYDNRPGLEYTHIFSPPNTQGTMFLLTNNDVLFSTSVKRNISQQDGIESLTTIPSTSGEQYHYLYKPQTKRWYKFILPPQQGVDCLSCFLEDFFQEVLVNGGIVLGRYVLPIEDIYIVITGEDFDGVESSRAVAAGFILIDVIPGSSIIKGIKLVKYGDEVIDATQVVVKYVDNVFKAQKKIVDDVLNGLEVLTNNTRRGNFGEIVVDVDLFEKGYSFRNRTNGVVDLNDTSIHTNGIDHIIQNDAGEFFLIETKYNTAQLANNTANGPQMGIDWIENHLNSLGALGDEIMDEGYTSVLAHVSTDGEITYTILNDLAQSIGSWTP